MNNNEATAFVIDCLTDPGNKDKQAALHEWLQQSEEHRELYAELQQLWKAAADIPPAPFNVSAGWNELSQQIMPPVKVKRMYPRWAAAVILLLLGAAAWYWMDTSRGGVITYMARPLEKDSLQLPDGTLVYLKPGSSLQYDKKFKERKVALLAGEAYFTVAHDASRQFEVTAASAAVKVLGTAFNVRIGKTCTEVIVCEGRVSLHNNDREVILSAEGDNLGKTDKNSNTISHPQGNYANRCVWATNELVFENETAQHIADVISAHYHQPTLTIAERLKNKRLTMRFNNTPYEEALQTFEALLDE